MKQGGREQQTCTTLYHQETCDLEQNDGWLYQREVGCREEREWGQVRSPKAHHTTGKMRRIHDPEQTTSSLSSRYDLKNERATFVSPNTCFKRYKRRSWSIVSKAALRSRSVRTEISSVSPAVNRSLKTRSSAVSVLWWGL